MPDIPRPPRAATRRRALLAGGTAGLLTAPAAPRAQSRAEPVPEWTRAQGDPVVHPPYGNPSPHERHVVRRPRTVPPPTPTAASSGTPLGELHGIITPNGLHFERHHAGVPAIDPDAHRLLLHGLVRQPLIFTMDDLLRFPAVSRIHFMECSGNTPWAPGRADWTVRESHGLLSCAEWTGVPLGTLLDAAGLRPEARWVLAEGADGAAMTRSIPIRKALDDVLVAYAQNGERLRPEQGYPLRLFVPGFEGNMSIKWLRRLKLGDQPFQTREETSKYTDLLPDGTAQQFTFVMHAKSVITAPSGGQALRGGPGPREIRGLAWSGHGRVRRVEVSLDGGASWREAALEGPVRDKCLTRFRLPWDWDGGPARLQSRATDETGYVQPTREALVARFGRNSTYHYNGIQGWQVAAGGAVTYVA